MAPGILLTDSCGSPNYAAPELLQKGCQYEGPEVDVWAMGVILYALLCSSLPFDAPAYSELFRIIKSGRYKVPGFLSEEAADLIGRMLVVDPSKRARIAEIRNHSWFQKDLPLKLAEKKVPPLPNLLLRKDAAPFNNTSPPDYRREEFKPHGRSRSSGSLEKKILAERCDTPQRCASTFASASASTMSSECISPQGLDVRHNPLYIFSNQLVF